MNDDWTPEERQLAAAFDEVGLPARPSGDRRSRLPSSGNRRLRALVAVGAVGALAAGAILVPRFAAPSSTVGSTRGTGCEVALPASWLRAAQRQLPATPKGVEPFAVSPNGEEYFAAVEAASWSGVVEVSATTGAVQRIEEFPDPTSTVNPYGPNVYPTVTSKPAATVDDGHFDGRWLVWDQARQLKGGASASSVMARRWSVLRGGLNSPGPHERCGLDRVGRVPHRCVRTHPLPALFAADASLDSRCRQPPSELIRRRLLLAAHPALRCRRPLGRGGEMASGGDRGQQR